MSTTIDIVRENFKARSEIQGELRAIDEAATADKRDYTDDERATIEEKRSALKAIDDRISANLEMQVREEAINAGLDRFLGAVADRDGHIEDTRSLGQRFNTDELRSWVSNGAHGTSPIAEMEMDFRAVTDTTTGATSGGALYQPQRLGRIGQDFLNRRTFLIDLLPHIPVSTGSVEVVQDQSPLADMNEKAVEVAEGSAKPQAGITLAVVDEAIRDIAAWVNITRQVARDSRQVMGYLDGRLRYSVKRRADAQVINGNGTSPNISGLLDRSGINAYTVDGANDPEDTAVSIRKAITLMEQDEAVPEIVVLNPADAELFDLTNYADDGLHAVPNVAGPGARTAWGLTQVRSTAIASGTALLVDPMAVAVLDREQVRAYMTDSHASNFTANILTLLVEAALGLAVFEPAGICSVTFDYTA